MYPGLGDAIHLMSLQLCLQLPAHEYGRRRGFWHRGVSWAGFQDEINFYVRAAKEKNQLYDLDFFFPPVARRRAFFFKRNALVWKCKPSRPMNGSAWFLYMRCTQGFLTGSMHHEPHISLISQETPLDLATADCELLSNADFRCKVLSLISAAVVSVVGVMKQL